MPRSIAMTLSLAVLLLGAASAPAAEAPTRDEYVDQLEPICKPGAEATERVMKGVRADVDAGRVGLAAHKFERAAKLFGDTVDAIAPVPRPAADKARLTRWFTYLDQQRDYLKEITAQLKAGHTIKAQRLTARFIHSGNLANNVVLAFGFNHCSFRFSRYG